MSSPGRLVILGDLNFHVDNAADSNAKKFLDLLDLLNFSQHVTSITHKAGHTLDLVITRDSEAVIDNVTFSDLLSVIRQSKGCRTGESLRRQEAGTERRDYTAVNTAPTMQTCG